MSNIKKYFLSLSLCLMLLIPQPARADFWGGDIPLLIKLIATSLEQLITLRQIFKNGNDSLGLMREINQGIRNGLAAIQIINPRFNPGLYGNLETSERVMAMITDLYGKIPQTSEYRLQEAQDRSVSESIAMNGTLFRYADDVDAETKRIIAHAEVVNPQGAAKLTAQSLAVLIGVTTQVLRTNSMMLKMMGQNMALSNRKEKLQSQQFRTQYDGISSALGEIHKVPKLVPLSN
jgi:hypothetical protein